MQNLRAEAAAGRLRLLREAMAERQIDLVLLYGSGRHHLTQANACWYFSGFRQMGRDACLVMPLTGEPLLIVTPSWDQERAVERSWIPEVVATDTLVSTLHKELARRSWNRGVTAILGVEAASPAVARAVAGIFGDAVNDGGLSRVLLRNHDAYGLALIEQAVRIAEAGYSRLREVVHPGIREHELAAECDIRMRELGSEDNFLIISGSQHHLGLRPAADRILCEGDIVLAEVSPAIDGQFAQICRTLTLGQPAEELISAYEILQQALAAGVVASNPGTSIKEVTQVVNEVIAAHGFGEYCRQPYMRARGHAVGLGPMVPAEVSDRSDVLLEPGLSFVLHPNQYFPHVGYLLCGEQIVIESAGARILPNRRAKLDVIVEGSTV